MPTDTVLDLKLKSQQANPRVPRGPNRYLELAPRKELTPGVLYVVSHLEVPDPKAERNLDRRPLRELKLGSFVIADAIDEEAPQVADIAQVIVEGDAPNPFAENGVGIRVGYLRDNTTANDDLWLVLREPGKKEVASLALALPDGTSELGGRPRPHAPSASAIIHFDSSCFQDSIRLSAPGRSGYEISLRDLAGNESKPQRAAVQSIPEPTKEPQDAPPDPELEKVRYIPGYGLIARGPAQRILGYSLMTALALLLTGYAIGRWRKS